MQALLQRETARLPHPTPPPAAAAAALECGRCGSDLVDHDRFCSSCGAVTLDDGRFVAAYDPDR